MPNAALLVMGSPALLTPLPIEASVHQTIVAPAEIASEASNPSRLNLIPINIELVSPQEAQGPQETGQHSPESGEEEQDHSTGDEIVVQGTYGPPEGDPMAAVNETTFRLAQGVDGAVIEPLAYAYRDGLPDPLRDGLGNVVRNLSEPVNFLNFLLQGKFGKAFETLGRFTINSSLGLGGLIDVAGKPGIGLPYRRNGFANTLGFYGVEPGAYLYLPIAGATTVRDLVGNSIDQLVLPTVAGAPFNTPEYTIPYFVVSNLDSRLRFDEQLGRINDAVDPYAARRDSYLAMRERDIALLRGEEPPETPAILREVEEGVFEIDQEIEEEAAPSGDVVEGVEAAPSINPSEAPAISYQDTLEAPPKPVVVAVLPERVAITGFSGR